MSPFAAPTEARSEPTRIGLAIAIVVAGGVLTPMAGIAGLVISVVLALFWRRALGAESAPARPPHWLESLALALVLALLVRALGRVLVATPAMLFALPVVLMLACLPSAHSVGRRWALALGLTGLAGLAGLAGSQSEAAGVQPRGMVRSGPILGVHPRQSVAITIDGFGPHDVIADDYVEPAGGQGRDEASWAGRLEAELRQIAELHYAHGPARAREAFARAEVSVAEPAIGESDRESIAQRTGIEVRSGTTGEGSRVEFGCPGAVIDPRPAGRVADTNECPRKYARDGSTGLGLSARWAGYTEFRGRDRWRLAALLGAPSGDVDRDRRIAGWELALLALGSAIVMLGLATRASETLALAPAVVGLIGLFGAVLLDGGELPLASDVGMLLPLGLLLALSGPNRSDPPMPSATLALGGLALLAISPLAGRATVVAIDETVVEHLVLGGGLGWAYARVVAGTLVLVAIVPGACACARWLIRPATPPSPSAPPRTGAHGLGLAGLTLALGLGLALRKPGGDAALLAGATAILLACRLPVPRFRGALVACTGVLAFAAGFPLLGPGPRDPVSTGLVAGTVLLTLVGGWLSGRRLER